jgi:hypothetical protein
MLVVQAAMRSLFDESAGQLLKRAAVSLRPRTLAAKPDPQADWQEQVLQKTICILSKRQ